MPKEYDPRPAATRLAAVQAVYELDMMEADVDDVLASFSAERWLKADDESDQEMARPKPELLKDLVRGVSLHSAQIDAALSPEMIQNRDVDAMETVLRAILKTATFELLERKNPDEIKALLNNALVTIEMITTEDEPHLTSVERALAFVTQTYRTA